MTGGWSFSKLLWVVLVVQLQARSCGSVNLEGRALLRFRSRVEVDPYGALRNWDARDNDPCGWNGVRCVDGKVETLKLNQLSLGGILAPELGELSHLRSLVLFQNKFSGAIPKEIAGLTMLELLDLRGNNLNGTIPAEMGEMLSLKRLLLCDNKFQGNPPSLEKHSVHQNLSSDVDSEIFCINRKVGCCILRSGLKQLKMADSFMILVKWKLLNFLDMFKFKRDSSSNGHQEIKGVNMLSFTKPYAVQNIHAVNYFRRKLLQETSNLPAAPITGATPRELVSLPSTGSGSFPAVPNSNSRNRLTQASEPDIASILSADTVTTPYNQLPSKPTNTIENKSSSSGKLGHWIYSFIFPLVATLAIVASMLLACRTRRVATSPWKTGLSGQLQKAFITGVPKLNRSELEAACEDFSNIICTYPVCTVFKGTLSSGVEIAVLSTSVASASDWSKRAGTRFRRKIDMLSRVNHKNFVNLLGYCEENEPFMRMMVFEYVSNGTLFEHLHVQEFEHLDWNARMRIIMGMAYCLQYLHHELNPPVALPELQSRAVYMTDDYSAKLADISIWREVAAKSGDGDMDPSESPVDLGSNVYGFGMLLLEIISGKLQYSEEQGSLLNWATEYLNESRNMRHLVDPALKSFKNEELEIVVEVIQECIHQDPRNRPTMKEVVSKLREVIAISPEAATPRLSPLWWAELEILSVEAS